MTQFLRVTDRQAKTSPDGIDHAIRRIEGIEAFPTGEGWISVVSAADSSSAGPLVDELHNFLSSGRDVASTALIRLLRAAAENGWCVEMWYSNDSDVLPLFTDIHGAVHSLLEQASMQPPEIWLRFQP
jgi:hypothetical protein